MRSEQEVMGQRAGQGSSGSHTGAKEGGCGAGRADKRRFKGNGDRTW